MKTWWSAVVLAFVPVAAAAQSAPPILDVHLHALRAVDQGPPPLAMCLPSRGFPAAESGSTWGQAFLTTSRNPACSDPIWSPATDQELMERTPGAPYLGFGDYRARLHSPLLLEEVLIRHPDLRLYVMHAGWPMIDDLLALLWAHPQVHVGTGVLGFALPRTEFHRYLQRIVEAGFGDRVMFGSDQMVWPEALEIAVQGIETAPFLSEAQKRAILYDNAARFLRLSDAEIDRHHGRAR